MEKTQHSEEELFMRFKHTAAYQLGLVALERQCVYGSSLPIEGEELQDIMKKNAQPNS